jgi:hypothetical protein
VHLEVPQEGSAAVLTLEPHVALLLGRSLVSHAQSLLPAELTREDALRASYSEFQSTRDLHELARAVGNILDVGGD